VGNEAERGGRRGERERGRERADWGVLGWFGMEDSDGYASLAWEGVYYFSSGGE